MELNEFGDVLYRSPNINPEIVKQLAEKLNLTYVPERELEGNVCFINNPEVRPDFRVSFSSIDIQNYIYAVLLSPANCNKYSEFLETGFPRLPNPRDAVTFWQLVELGDKLRQIHLLESPLVNHFITSYPVDGDNTVGEVHFEDERVYINYQKTYSSRRLEGLQYFGNVPKIAWEFYFGGYQPAQKWLKDKKGYTLNLDDILHYQKIIVALKETGFLMLEVDKIEVE
ncbi:MAG TPA: hypothetical protein PLC80_17915 [Draconibacterium sp.]|nr:hypothetical protein [Draconibacterium sp.]